MTVRDVILITTILLFGVGLVLMQDTFNSRMDEIRQENGVLRGNQIKLQKQLLEQKRIIDSLRTVPPPDLREAYPFPQYPQQ